MDGMVGPLRLGRSVRLPSTSAPLPYRREGESEAGGISEENLEPENATHSVIDIRGKYHGSSWVATVPSQSLRAANFIGSFKQGGEGLSSPEVERSNGNNLRGDTNEEIRSTGEN